MQHRRMQRIIQMCDFLVGTVDGQRILDQVVGPDRQEIQLLGECTQRQRGSRDFDHAAYRHIAVVGNTFRVQVGLDVVDELQRLVDFRDTAQHRHQDFHVAVM